MVVKGYSLGDVFIVSCVFGFKVGIEVKLVFVEDGDFLVMETLVIVGGDV